MKLVLVLSVLGGMAMGMSGGVAAAAGVRHTVTTVKGMSVDKYVWTDTKGLARSVSLKREGGGNPGHGGYAIQMTYQTGPAGARKLITVNAEPNDGFGYFVSHERYRDFTDGGNNTIAAKIFHKDDSPLGRGFPAVGKTLAVGDPTMAAHRFTMKYPRYGTKAAIPKAPSGDDVKKSPVAATAYKLYTLPITITWYFQNGTDYPRIQYIVGFGDVPGPDRVNFDIRGPYGVMRFDNGLNANIGKVMWGDRFHFTTVGSPLTRGSGWTWKGVNRGARYNALIAGGFEMGLFEPVAFKRSIFTDPFSEERGSRSADYNGGMGCKYQPQLVPCDWEWPYQSAQYSLPNDKVTPTDYKKIAWGSSAFYGTGPSLTQVYDTSNTSLPIKGYPANHKITYNVCVVLGVAVAGGLTKTAASARANYSCAGFP